MSENADGSAFVSEASSSREGSPGRELGVEQQSSSRSTRSVRFDSLSSDYRLDSSRLESILEAVPSEQDGLEQSEAAGQIQQNDTSEQRNSVSGAQQMKGKRLRSNTSILKRFRGTRHQSLMQPELTEPDYFSEFHRPATSKSDTNEQLELEPGQVSPHTIDHSYRSRARSEPPVPMSSLLARMSPFPRDPTGRPRRPTISEAGIGLVNGITDTTPHPGIVAAAFVYAVEIPGPKEVIMRSAPTKAKRSSAVTTQSDLEAGNVLPEVVIPDKALAYKRNLWLLTSTYLKLALWFVCTIKGFFITLYLLLVIAFGGMLFLILVGAAPAMNRPDGPNGSDTPGKRWIEYDSQVLNGLFCLTGFGLMPQRTKHLWILIRGQIGNQNKADISLIKRYNWYLPTINWYKLAAVLYLYELNSLFQIAMAAGMWAYNRHNRPPWLTGVTIGLGFAYVYKLLQILRQTANKQDLL
ncbi:hypothetical protein V1512DRAFT_265597 [Lipomyces arxii]|uniref:uncharacterized protein n=1 Tax=Lipomyces arxii TaxID=56418 RepID=UPI0034CFF63B